MRYSTEASGRERRLAEGVLARAATEKTSGKKKGKKKEGGKKRKLAKIPGQKT